MAMSRMAEPKEQWGKGQCTQMMILSCILT